MTSYKIEQRHLTHRGRAFHFVSYEGRPAHERRGESELPPMWYLMNEGKRLPVMPHLVGQDAAEVEGAFLRWIEERIDGPVAVVPVPAPVPVRARRTRAR